MKIGIDVGGTKIEGVILDPTNHLVFRKRMPTEQDRGYAHILSQISVLYSELKEYIKNKSHSLGIGTPGALNAKALMKNSNTLCLNGKPFEKDLRAVLNHPLQIENDANCFALAEALLGAGKGSRLVFGVIMGTGCGGGIVVDGKLLNGPNSLTGEWGHSVIDPTGPLCYCGKRGCVETFISGPAVERKYFEESGQKISMEDIVSKYRQNDSRAGKVFGGFLHVFGMSLSNIVNILEPDRIVLGGGLSNIDELYEEGRQQVEKNIFGHEWSGELVKNELGDSAGVIGAALLGK